MKKRTVKLYNTNVIEVVDYLKRVTNFDYVNFDSHFFVLGKEQYYIRNNSTQMNLLIGKNENDSTLIDIIGGAGGVGLLNISFGSNSHFVNEAFDLLDQYAKKNNKHLENLECY